MTAKSLKSIYTYSDFRIYLKDYFEVRNQADLSFSHRAMARELGFPSPNHIKLVMDGKQRVGLRSLNRLIEGLGLRDREKEYFSYMVFFCQAKTAVEKDFYYKRLLDFRPAADLGSITSREYEYYSNWYTCVVRELVVRMPVPIDYSLLAKQVYPRITSTQTRKAVELLLELGIIHGSVEKGFELSSRLISTDREVTSLGIRNFHAHMIDLGKKSMDSVDRNNREISSVTMCVSAEGMLRIKNRIQEFEDEIFKIVQQDENTRDVYQLNFQFFPVSQKETVV